MALKSLTDMAGGGGGSTSDSDSGSDDDEKNNKQTEQAPTTAAMGNLRALTDPDAGDQSVAQESTAQTGTVVDFLEDPSPGGQDVIASDGDKDTTDTGVVATPEGGAVVETRDGSPTSAGPGRERLASLSDESDDSGESSPEWEAGANVTKNTWPGDPVSVSALVMNNGPAGTRGGGTANVTVSISGTGMSQSETVELGGGSRRSLDFTFGGARSLSPGEYTATVSINGNRMDSATFTRYEENGGSVNSSSDIDSSNSGSSSSDSQSQPSENDPGQMTGNPLPYTAFSGGGGSSDGGSGGAGMLSDLDPMMGVLAVAALGGAYAYTQRGS